MRFVRCLVLLAICGLVIHARPSVSAAAMRGAPSSPPIAASGHAIQQIAPAARAHADPDLAVMEPFGQPRSRRSRKARAGANASYRTLADALIEPTDAEKRDLTKQFGLPVIEGVPPIHMLFPPGEDHRPLSGF
jgi:hypothetical protein